MKQKHITGPGVTANWTNFQLPNIKKFKIKNQIVMIVTFKKENSIEYLHYKTYN
jgi:hypothetical protein